ncbi:TonB-dependent receptor [Aquirufa regiilacus]|uniref:TonB-dependent receptor n=1 Tax=Aquirufa regiilacus TaxID=3024868 RepID=A0ABU3TTD6_9BACT|nr:MULTISPECIES: TonB-dependent receptor [unclassified Aquirufa]MDT8886070.1 TonB-dependent receptor [Aquirufa sp. LEPPI-3A]MDU0809131.1 TonB-dependent receptor [Aquirufa sp. LEOWEIH-7C]
MKTIKVLVLFVLSTVTAIAQDGGTIRGTIKDSKTKEDIIGATILVQGINKGAATDINGFFSFGKLPVGSYSLKISFVGYESKIYEGVKVAANQVTELNLSLAEESATLAEVKVVAQKLTNTEQSVISEIKAAQLVVSGISAAQITKTLDRTAAEVVKRVPGVTIFGERFINIRGLNERYNTVQLNNAFAPSMETDVRSFSFDIIPAGQIDRILVFKSPSAEIPGEFAGGVVKIFTKSIPENNFLTLDISSAYREGTTGAAFFATKNANMAWTGFDQGYFDLPKSFPINRSALINTGASGIDAIGASLKNNWVPVESNAMPDMRASLAGGLKFDLGSVRIGNVTAVNYSNTRSIFKMERNDWGYSNIQTTGEPDEIFNYVDNQYSNAIRLGVSHNWSARFAGGSVIEFKNLFNQLANTQYIQRSGFDNGSNWDIRSFDQVFRGIYTGQLTGRHEFQEGSLKTDWMVGYNSAYRNQPDYKRFRYNVDGSSSSLFIPNGAAQTFLLGRTYINMDESSYTAAFNLDKRIKVGDEKELDFKAGLFYEDKVRDFGARNIGYVKSTPSFQTTLPIDQLFSPQNFNSRTGIKIDEQTNPNDSYNATNNLFAAYVSANYALGKKFNAIVGVRAEQNSQKLNSADLVGKAINYDNTRLDVLPSLNLTYNFTEKSLLRLAYGKTLNRPEFRELAPFSFYDFVNNRTVSGNPTLKNAEIQNFDFRYEFYPTPTELVSIAAFYKDFTNPIEVVFASGANPILNFSNAKSAYSTGIEAEFRKNLNANQPNTILGRTSFVFNGTYIFSRVKLDATVAKDQSDNRPLQGQSPYIVNAGLNYNDAKKGLQLNFNYNVIGKRIFAVGNNFGSPYPDWFEMPRNVIDFSFSKQLTKAIMLKGGVSDILNQGNTILQDGNQDQVFDRNQDQTIQNYAPGRVASLGLIISPFN